MLKAVNENGAGATKTQIIYKAFLSYAQMKEYLLLLAKSDLLQYGEIAHLQDYRKRDSFEDL